MSNQNDDSPLWPKRKSVFAYDDDLLKNELIDNIVEKGLKEQFQQELFKQQWLMDWNKPAETSAIDTTATSASKVMELRDKVQRLERQIRDMEREQLRKRVEEQDEELLRVTHPSVQDAYEKYLIVLRLAKTGK